MKIIGSFTLLVLLAFAQNADAQIIEIPSWISQYWATVTEFFENISSFQTSIQNWLGNVFIPTTTPRPTTTTTEHDQLDARFVKTKNESKNTGNVKGKLVASSNGNFYDSTSKKSEEIAFEEERSFRVKRAPQRPNSNPISGMLSVLETFVSNASRMAASLRNAAESIIESAISTGSGTRNIQSTPTNGKKEIK